MSNKARTLKQQIKQQQEAYFMIEQEFNNLKNEFKQQGSMLEKAKNDLHERDRSALKLRQLVFDAEAVKKEAKQIQKTHASELAEKNNIINQIREEGSANALLVIRLKERVKQLQQIVKDAKNQGKLSVESLEEVQSANAENSQEHEADSENGDGSEPGSGSLPSSQSLRLRKQARTENPGAKFEDEVTILETNNEEVVKKKPRKQPKKVAPARATEAARISEQADESQYSSAQNLEQAHQASLVVLEEEDEFDPEADVEDGPEPEEHTPPSFAPQSTPRRDEPKAQKAAA